MLLGDRYGSRPLPTVIPGREMASLLEHVQSPEAQALVERWYPLDTNAVPPLHALRPIYRNVTVKEAEAEAEAARVVAARGEWQRAEVALKDILRAAVSKCRDEGSMSEQQARKYFWSGKKLTREK
jgi:hypothetical protein